MISYHREKEAAGNEKKRIFKWQRARTGSSPVFLDLVTFPGITGRLAARVRRAFLLYRTGGNSAVRETRKKRAVATEFTGRKKVILSK